MDEKPDQIMNHIEAQRDQLGRNLNELENRVKGATDWRVQFDRNPMLMMGVALGGGLLLGSIVAGGKKGTSKSSWSSSSRNYATPASYSTGTSSNVSSALSSSTSPSSPAVQEQRKKATDALEHIKAALIGFATAKVKEFMTEALPGFNQHLDEAERRHTAAQSSYGSEQYGGSSSGRSSSYENTPMGSQLGNHATTRTEHSANSPYTQGAGQNTGLNI